MNNDNDDLFCCAQIEHIDAILNLKEIVAVPGIDAAFVGPYDLSASMGIAGQFDHPKFTQALEHFRFICSQAKVAAGIHVITPDPVEVEKRIQEGYQMIAYSLDVTILISATQKVAELLETANDPRKNRFTPSCR